MSPSLDAVASHVSLQCPNVTAVPERTRLSERGNTRYRKGGVSVQKVSRKGYRKGVLVQEGGVFLCRKGSRKGPGRVFLYHKGASCGVQ